MRASLLAAAFVIFSLTTAQAAPLGAYGEIPTLEYPALSPDGSRLAFLSEKDGQHFVVMEQLPGQLLAALNMKDRKVRAVIWGDQDHVLVTRSETVHPGHRWQDEWFGALMFDVVTKKESGLGTQFVGISKFPEPRIIDGRPVALITRIYGDDVSFESSADVDKIEFGSDVGTRLKHGGSYANGFIVDDKGRAVATSHYDAKSGHWWLELFFPGADTGKVVYSEDTLLDPPRLLGISPDGTALEISSHKAGGAELLAFSLADGHPVPSILHGGRGYTVFDRQTGRIVGERFVEHDVSYRFFAQRDQENWDRMIRHFPDEQVEQVSASSDRSKLIVHVTGRQHGDVYELIDTANDTAQLVGPARRGIGPGDIARVTQFSYATADGLQIDAYLTLPSGHPAEGLPLIVMPHDGPDLRDEPGFDWWAQALAAQGYAVLQPEYRGSDDLGWDLFAAGFGQFGRKMQTDLSDGVRALARTKVIDPKRVCIVGAGFGGYAALAGATIDTGAYRCAISVNGFGDPAELVKYGKRYEFTRWWMRFMGVSSDDDPSLDAISPLKQAARATIPVLLLYGDNDSEIPVTQSTRMADALAATRKPFSVVVLKGEDHWLSRSPTRIQMLQATVDFLRANNPP